MKKSFFAILAIAACFASCSKVVDHSLEVNQVITFDNYVGKDAMTRASVITVNQNENLKVKVNAYLRPKTDETSTFVSNFMTNVDVNANTGAYSPAKYWPAADQVVDFVAWVPEENISVENATLNFTVKEKADEQVDLLVATPVKGKNGATEDEKTPVGLVFNHLLSRIAFEIVATDIPSDGINVVTLTELSLNGSFASEGTVDMMAAVPAVAATEGKTTSKYEMKDYFGYTNGVMSTSTGNPATEYLMIIPDKNEPDFIKVTYVVTTYETEEGVDDEGNPILVPTETVVGTPITNTAKFALQPESGEFVYEAGKAYKYVFSIAMDTISFTVTEEPWAEETSDDIENNYPATPTPEQGA